MIESFQLDFSTWEENGFWDEAYRPFSFFAGNRVVANCSVYSLPAQINRKSALVAQLSAVATLPEYRRRGLNRQLTATALKWAHDHDAIFLFSTDEAIPFYRACGFRQISEQLEYHPIIVVTSKPGLIKLDPADRGDLRKIYQYACRRTPVSDRLSIGNARLFMFQCLYILQDSIYEIPELNCLVLFKREGSQLQLLDVAGEQIPEWEELCPYLVEPGDHELECHFHTDRFGIENPQTRTLIGNNPFVRDPFPFEQPVFPYTCRA